MKKSLILMSLALLSSTSLMFSVDAAFAAENATAAASPVVGKMLYSTGGKKLAAVYKISASGAPQLLLEGKLVTVPSATLSEVNGKVETSLTKKELLSKR
jgi:hypothetical protein